MLIKNRSEIHSKIFFGAVILLATSIPLSVFMMSVAQFILAGNWLLERGFKRKFTILKTRKSVLIFLSIFIIHVIWLLITDDYKYAFNDLRIKAPLFILPLIIGTSESLSSKQIKTVLTYLVFALFVSTVSSMSVLFGIFEKTLTSSRDISLFISHIRFALLLDVAIFSLFYFLTSSRYSLKKFEKTSYFVLLIWFVVFLFILKSFTGIFVFILLAFGVILFNIIQKKKIWFKLAISGILLFGIGTIFYIVGGVYNDFYNIEIVDFNNLDKRTLHGGHYWHDTLSGQIENGHYSYLYICDKEMEKEWNKKSKFLYRGKDKKNQDLRHTLIRYLTSLGLRKDAEGILKLKRNDIKAIENGLANQIYKNKYSIYARIYEIVWEFDVYRKGVNPSGHSLTQRIEYLKASKQLIIENFWFGVGTGDLKNEFKYYYNRTNSILLDSWRLRAHNQLVTFFIAFGLIGFLWILFAIFYPIYLEKGYKSFLFIIFLAIGMLSMLNEDTLETQAGVTFFVFLYSVLLFSPSKKESIKN